MEENMEESKGESKEESKGESKEESKGESKGQTLCSPHLLFLGKQYLKLVFEL